MLLRGQNLLGYRHYADDVVEKFVERAAVNGVDVFRVFDAMNDPRNLETALRAVKQHGKHAQGTISYTTSPVHTLEMWVDLAKQIEDMAPTPWRSRTWPASSPLYGVRTGLAPEGQPAIPIHMQCHATAGLSSVAILKAVEAGIDNVDTAISSLSMTYGHSPTESVVAMFQGPSATPDWTELLEEIAAYFREVRKKYAKFEGNLKGVDSRILVAQVPGGMLTNMESQLKEQGAQDKFDQVLAEIPARARGSGLHPAGNPDLADRWHPGGDQRAHR